MNRWRQVGEFECMDFACTAKALVVGQHRKLLCGSCFRREEVSMEGNNMEPKATDTSNASMEGL